MSAASARTRRIAVVDVGSNSTRLLVADVAADGGVEELARRSTVTRLGEGVERTGALDPDAIERVRAVLADYRREIDALGADEAAGVLTSAVRDADNGGELEDELRDRFGIDARVIGGEEEARLSYLGATNGRADSRTPTLVADIGGGSTELIVGTGGETAFHVSTQVGVVRHTERHLRHDPPAPAELEALRREVADQLAAAVPERVRAVPEHAIAVAGTPTQCAAVSLGLEPYDPARVHGHVLERAEIERILAELGSLPLERRRHVRGLDPERAPTIVAGAAILLEAMALFGLDAVEVSENDLLRGVALDRSGFVG